MEPDSLLLSPIPKEKISLGPFIPLPIDNYGRLISNKDNTKKSKADAQTQVRQISWKGKAKKCRLHKNSNKNL